MFFILGWENTHCLGKLRSAPLLRLIRLAACSSLERLPAVPRHLCSRCHEPSQSSAGGLASKLRTRAAMVIEGPSRGFRSSAA